MTDGPRVYVDMSALAALLIEQPETETLLAWLDGAPADLVSSDLLETEMRRITVREGLEQRQLQSLSTP